MQRSLGAIFIYFLDALLTYFHCSCLGHVINLGNVDVMGHITQIVAVENATAIWEYDPTWEDNRVLVGSLDVIATICTLTIKIIVVLSPCRLSYNISTWIQASGQCIKYFHSTQICCGIPEALEIPLYSNI